VILVLGVALLDIDGVVGLGVVVIADAVDVVVVNVVARVVTARVVGVVVVVVGEVGTGGCTDPTTPAIVQRMPGAFSADVVRVDG